MTPIKPLLLAALLAGATVAQAQQLPPTAPVAPQDKTQPSPRLNPAITARAEHLSDQMVRDLRLNNYQATQVRSLNADNMARLDAIEHQNIKNPTLAHEQAAAAAHEHDQRMQAVLTTDQYSDYFDARKRYAQADQDYARAASASIFVNSVENPTPTRPNNATIGPARATGKATRPAVRQ